MRCGRLVVSLAVGLAVMVAPAAISAQITFGQSTPIEFGSGRPSELTWSTGMRASPNGLETPPIDAAGDSTPLWWQSPPIPTGPSWRPPRSMSLTVPLSGLDVVSNSMGVGYVRTFVRYSADRVHWSTWYAMKAAEGTTGLAPAKFDLWLALPDVAGEEYETLMGDWRRTDPV